MVTSTRVTVKRKIRYESSNPAIAKVNEKTGKITGKKKGNCFVYVYAQNGLFEKVSVTVKSGTSVLPLLKQDIEL